jgi:hypothetical protein
MTRRFNCRASALPFPAAELTKREMSEFNSCVLVVEWATLVPPTVLTIL